VDWQISRLLAFTVSDAADGAALHGNVELLLYRHFRRLLDDQSSVGTHVQGDIAADLESMVAEGATCHLGENLLAGVQLDSNRQVRGGTFFLKGCLKGDNRPPLALEDCTHTPIGIEEGNDSAGSPEDNTGVLEGWLSSGVCQHSNNQQQQKQYDSF